MKTINVTTQQTPLNPSPLHTHTHAYISPLDDFKEMSCCAKGVKSNTNKPFNPVLLKGWEEFWSKEYQLPYFYNKKLKKTQWEHPGFSLPNSRNAVKFKQARKSKSNPGETGGIEAEYTSGTARGQKAVVCTFEEGPLGLKLREEMDRLGNIYIEVWEVMLCGQAGQHGALDEKDRLVKIGKQDVGHMELPEVMGIIKNARRPLRIEFQKPPPKATETAISRQALQRVQERRANEEKEAR